MYHPTVSTSFCQFTGLWLKGLRMSHQTIDIECNQAAWTPKTCTNLRSKSNDVYLRMTTFQPAAAIRIGIKLIIICIEAILFGIVQQPTTLSDVSSPNSDMQLVVISTGTRPELVICVPEQDTRQCTQLVLETWSVMHRSLVAMPTLVWNRLSFCTPHWLGDTHS